MNRPKQARVMIPVKPEGFIPKRQRPNNKRRLRQPPGYYFQKQDYRHVQPMSLRRKLSTFSAS